MGRGFDPHGAYRETTPTGGFFFGRPKYTSTMVFPLVTGRLEITPLARKHLASFVRYRQDPLVAKYQSWKPSYSDEQALDLIDSQTGVLFPALGDWLQLAIELRETHEHIGDLALHFVQGGVFEIGFTLAAEHQGNGYAKEAATRLLEYLFDEAKAELVFATPDERNLSSIRLLGALGFQEVPERSWVEEFKNETVTVSYFELRESSRAF